VGVYFFIAQYLSKMKDLILKVLREEVSNGKVTCDNCGWSWSLKDGGHDPYICHQCNHNNESNKLNEDYDSDYEDDIYRVFKKSLDKNGLSYRNVIRLMQVLNIKYVKPYLETYLNDRGIPGIFKKDENIVLRCNKCGGQDLNFIYKISDIYVVNMDFKYSSEIDIYVDVSDRGYGELDWDDGEYKGSFHKIVYYETEKDLYEFLHNAVVDAITNDLDEKLKNIGIQVNVTSLEFIPPSYILKN